MCAVKILELNGPNLQLLGRREPEVYGTHTLESIERMVREKAEKLGVTVEFRQENDEGALVSAIGGLPGRFDGLMLNAAAYTHTSVALYDALRAVGVPCVEVHLSNPAAREAFRHHSYLSAVARAVMCGFGVAGYGLAIDALAQMQ